MSDKLKYLEKLTFYKSIKNSSGLNLVDNLFWEASKGVGPIWICRWKLNTCLNLVLWLTTLNLPFFFIIIMKGNAYDFFFFYSSSIQFNKKQLSIQLSCVKMKNGIGPFSISKNWNILFHFIFIFYFLYFKTRVSSLLQHIYTNGMTFIEILSHVL